MINIEEYLEELISGKAVVIRPMVDDFEIYSNKDNFEFDNDNYKKEEELINLHEEEEILIKVSEEVEDHNLLQEEIRVENDDESKSLLNYFDEIERGNKYLKALKKRYDNRKKVSDKKIYMYEIYMYLKILICKISKCDDCCKLFIIELNDRLNKEMSIDEIYSIKGNGYTLLRELKELQEIVLNLDFDRRDYTNNFIEYISRYYSNVAIASINQIIDDYFVEPNSIYIKNRSKKHTKRDTKRETYFNLYKQGYSYSEIAKILNVSKAAVSKFFKNNPIE